MGTFKDNRYVIGAIRNLPPAKVNGENHAGADVDTDIEQLDTVEKTPSRVQAAKAKVNKHWKRFWCCYLLGIIIFLAIFLPILFLVIVPAIAQRIVDDTNLPVYSADILDPKPDSITFILHTSLTLPAGIEAQTDPFSLSLFDRNVKPMQPYLKVPMDGYDLSGTTNISVTRKDEEILSEQQFVNVLSHAVNQRKFTLSAKGKTTGYLGELKAPLTLDKNIKLDGLDKLRGFSINSAKLLIPAKDNGTNLAGVATLPNRSVFTFALGNVTLNLQSSSLVIGQATISNVVLKPGNNTVFLTGMLDIPKILDNIQDIISAQKDALRDGEIELSASGNKTVYNGHHIRYYEEVLNDLTITTRVPVMKLLMDTLQGLLGGKNGSKIEDAIQEVKQSLGSGGGGDGGGGGSKELRLV